MKDSQKASSAVSIFVPTYEPNPSHLLEALASIKKQTFSDWTVTIGDDASRIDVRSIVREYLHDPRFSFQRNTHRLGIGGNWNACMRQKSLGMYVQFLFQDDSWDPRYLEKSVALMEREPSVGIVAALHRYVVEGNAEFRAKKQPFYIRCHAKQAESLPVLPQNGLEFLNSWIEIGLSFNSIGEPSFVLFRSSLIPIVGEFDETMKQGLDMDFWIRCLLHTSLCGIHEDLGSFRVHDEGASAKNFSKGHGFYDRLCTFEKLLELLPPGNLREKTKISLRERMTEMMRRTFRFAAKNETQGLAKSYALRFSMRHPFLAIEALFKFLSTR